MTEFSFFTPDEKTEGAATEISTPEKPLTSEDVEKKIAEQTADTAAPKRKYTRRAEKKENAEPEKVPENVKMMFGPIIVAGHNLLLKMVKLSPMDKEQEKMVTDGYAMLLHKRIPDLITKHGDIIAAVGATAYVAFAKLSTETDVFSFGGKHGKKVEQHQHSTGAEGVGQDRTI